MKKIIVIFCLAMSFVCISLYGHDPSTLCSTGGESTEVKQVSKPVINYPSRIKHFIYEIKKIQRTLIGKLASLFNGLKEGKSCKGFYLLLLVSFLYGILHAVGPGHGKTLMASYFLSKKSHITEGLMAGAIIGFIHAFSATIIVTAIYFFLKTSYLYNFQKISVVIKVASALLIMAIGLFLLVKGLYTEFRRTDKKAKLLSDKKDGKKGMSVLAISIGIVPCPGATIIILFSINKDVVPAGIMAVFAMSLGMTVTISLLSMLTIVAKRYVLEFAQKRSRLYRIFRFSLQVISSVFIIILGLFLLRMNF